MSVVDEHGFGSTAIFIRQLRNQLVEMYALAQANVQLSFEALLKQDHNLLEQVTEQEDKIDRFNADIIRRIGKASMNEMSERDSETLNRMLVLSSNIERIGDHAMNMAEYLVPLEKHNVSLDKITETELTNLKELAAKALSSIDIANSEQKEEHLKLVTTLETESDVLSTDYRKAQIQRLRSGDSDPELSILYSEMLTDVERMLDHTLNIAEAVYA